MKIKNVVICAFFVVTFVVLTLFTSPKDISKYDLVSGIAIDYDQNIYTVTVEICTASTDDFLSKTNYVKGKGFTVDEALYKASLKNNNLMFLDSAQLYLIGEKAAKNKALADFLVSDSANVRATCVVTKGAASKVLKSESDSNSRAKSLSLSHKLKEMVNDQNGSVPNVISFLKNDNFVFINKDGLVKTTGEKK